MSAGGIFYCRLARGGLSTLLRSEQWREVEQWSSGEVEREAIGGGINLAGKAGRLANGNGEGRGSMTCHSPAF